MHDCLTCGGVPGTAVNGSAHRVVAAPHHLLAIAAQTQLATARHAPFPSLVRRLQPLGPGLSFNLVANSQVRRLGPADEGALGGMTDLCGILYATEALGIEAGGQVLVGSSTSEAGRVTGSGPSWTVSTRLRPKLSRYSDLEHRAK